MPEIVDADAYVARLLAAPRPGGENLLAFYEHRLGVIGTDPRLLLIPLDDHLVHRGDGVFETLKYVDGRLYQVAPHFERMERSAAAIHLAPPCPWGEVADLTLAVCRAGRADTGMVRVIVGRGPGGFGIDPAECPVPSLTIVAYRFHPRPAEAFEKGVTAFRTSIPAKQNYLARIKSIDYLPNVLMKREATMRGEDYPVCYDDKGFLAEGATENICLVDADGRFVVPELNNALRGTTLMRAVELLAGEAEVVFAPVREEAIATAREMMILGTTNDCLSIVRYNGAPVGDGKPGPVSRLLKARILADIAKNGTPI
ncbi:aminotransferase class IV [Solidesulfovibrio sp.]|uniref:aminotransferase class IV n=1 Tax=Solidesulfovibrio sp. TaxID=2910990 RepID=UPI00261D04D4|nr:aminotransferase class IV [Solidesulfovibrio sp.]